MGCPESHPYAYDYYANNDYCCAHDPAQDPDSDYCRDDSDEVVGQACENWGVSTPCENHPSVTSGAAGTDQTAETGKSFKI